MIHWHISEPVATSCREPLIQTETNQTQREQQADHNPRYSRSIRHTVSLVL